MVLASILQSPLDFHLCHLFRILAKSLKEINMIRRVARSRYRLNSWLYTHSSCRNLMRKVRRKSKRLSQKVFRGSLVVKKNICFVRYYFRKVVEHFNILITEVKPIFMNFFPGKSHVMPILQASLVISNSKKVVDRFLFLFWADIRLQVKIVQWKVHKFLALLPTLSFIKGISLYAESFNLYY